MHLQCGIDIARTKQRVISAYIKRFPPLGFVIYIKINFHVVCFRITKYIIFSILIPQEQFPKPDTFRRILPSQGRVLHVCL